MSPTSPNVTDMSATLIIHGQCLSHLTPHALIDFEGSKPPIPIHLPIQQCFPRNVQVEVKMRAAGFT